MRVVLVSEDQGLADILARSIMAASDELVVTTDPEFAQQQLQDDSSGALIVSDRGGDIGNISVFAEEADQQERTMQRIMLLSNYHHADLNEKMMKECLAEGWLVVHPGLSDKQVAGKIGEYLYGKRMSNQPGRSRIIQLLGTTPNIGTTVASYGLATHMAKLANVRIGYLCLNLKSSKVHRYLGEGNPTLSLDGLRAELRSGNMNGQRLGRQCVSSPSQPNLRILYGNMQREQADYYSVAEIDELLVAASEIFDYCIVETSAYWDNAATIGTMLHAGRRIVVTTPHLSNFQEDTIRWLKVLAPIFDFDINAFDLLVTQVDPAGPYRAKDVAREANISRIGELRKSPDLEWLLATGRLKEAVEDGTRLGADCARLARTVLTLYGEPDMKTAAIIPERSKWLAGLLPIGRRVGALGK